MKTCPHFTTKSLKFSFKTIAEHFQNWQPNPNQIQTKPKTLQIEDTFSFILFCVGVNCGAAATKDLKIYIFYYFVGFYKNWNFFTNLLSHFFKLLFIYFFIVELFEGQKTNRTNHKDSRIISPGISPRARPIITRDSHLLRNGSSFVAKLDLVQEKAFMKEEEVLGWFGREYI